MTVDPLMHLKLVSQLLVRAVSALNLVGPGNAEAGADGNCNVNMRCGALANITSERLS